jgi:cell wall-associated NlpC family hydrolase
MNPFYNTPERIHALQTAAAGWLGTPFVPNAAIRGHGVSCQKLVGRLYIETGFLPETFALPDAPMDWSHAHTESLVTRVINAHPEFFAPLPRIAPGDLQPGDLLGFKIGGCVHHLGVVLERGGQFIHVLRRHNVRHSHAGDASYWSRLENLWRPVSAATTATPVEL